MTNYDQTKLSSDKQALLLFIEELQLFLQKRQADGYPPRLGYAAKFTLPFVTDLKNKVANIQKYVEAEADFRFALELCQHKNILTLFEARNLYGGFAKTYYLADGIDDIKTVICQMEKRICGEILGDMMQADYWHIYGDEIIRYKNTPYLEEKRPIPTTIPQTKINAAESKYDSDNSSLYSYLVGTKEERNERLEIMHLAMDGKRGKTAAKFLYIFIEAKKWLLLPPFEVLKKGFKLEGSKFMLTHLRQDKLTYDDCKKEGNIINELIREKEGKN